MIARSSRKFLKDIAITAAVFLSILAAFNLIIDPYGVFNLVQSPRLQNAKVGQGGRIAKAEQIRRHPWDTILLGNSRVDAGLDPTNPAFGKTRVYNCGLSGLGFIEQAKIFEAIEQTSHPAAVILCIDFFHFQDNAAISDEFAHSRFDLDRSSIGHYLESLWGATPTWHAWQTWSNYRAHRPADYSDLGLRTKPMAPPGQSGSAAFEAYVAHAADTWHRQGAYSGHVKCLEALSRVLQSAARNNTRLTVVIMPVHALDLEMARCQLGSIAPIEDLKRGLVRTLADFRRQNPTGPIVPLWDFTGYRGYTADPIPPKNDPGPMRWYWEPSHFRKELGDLLICRILSQPPPSTLASTALITTAVKSTAVDAIAPTPPCPPAAISPTDPEFLRFGVTIDDTNIEAHLAQLRADREVFAKDFAPQIQYMQQRTSSANPPPRRGASE